VIVMAAKAERGRRSWTLAVAVCVLVTCVSAVALAIWSTYYAHHPLWAEHAAYGILANLQFNDSLEYEGYLSALENTFGRARFFLQPALLGLIWPRLLSSPHSHVLVNALALCLYLSFLVCFVHRRTGSRFLAIGAAVMFCSLAGLYDESGGVGVPWPDYQSMFILSSAVLSLGLYALHARVRWLMLTGTFVTLATLARDTGAAYAAIVCVPILTWLLVRDARNGCGWRGVVGRLAACGIPALPAMILLFGRLTFFQQYYLTANAIQLRQPLDVAAQSIWELFSRFTGVLPLVCGAVLLLTGLVLGSRRRRSTADFVVTWWPLSFLAFLLINGYTSDVTKEVMYIAPGLVCAMFTLGGGIDMQLRQARPMVVAILSICVMGAALSATRAHDRAGHPPANAVLLRNDQRALAEALASFPQRVTWQSYLLYDWGTVVSALTAYDFGHYQPADNRWFHNRRNYWDANFPNMDLPALQTYVLEQAGAHMDLVIVLAHPDEKPAGMEDYSFSIASFIAEGVQADAAWTHYRDVDSALVGALGLYLNTRRVGVKRRVE
jgi:hypothetical protein